MNLGQRLQNILLSGKAPAEQHAEIMALLPADVRALQAEVAADKAAYLHQGAELAKAAEREREAARRTAARLQLVRRWVDLVAGAGAFLWTRERLSELVNIVDGTTPLPEDLRPSSEMQTPEWQQRQREGHRFLADASAQGARISPPIGPGETIGFDLRTTLTSPQRARVEAARAYMHSIEGIAKVHFDVLLTLIDRLTRPPDSGGPEPAP